MISGEVVGLYVDSSNTPAWLLKIGTKYTSINVKGGTNHRAYGSTMRAILLCTRMNSAGSVIRFLPPTGKKFKPSATPRQVQLWEAPTSIAAQ